MTRLPRLLLGLIGAMVATGLIAGCASTDRRASDRSTDPFREPPTTAPAPTTSTTTMVDPECDKDNPARSLSPIGPLPAPGQMPAGSTMAAIQANEVLKVGVDQNTLRFGYRDPRSGDLDGFDIDVAREIARAIFGDPTKIQFTVVTTAERQDAVTSGDVDLVASLYTINCARWYRVAFSSEYYRAAQGVLVRNDSGILNLPDLAGRRVCVTSTSTASTNPLFTTLQPQPMPVLAASRTECLGRLQDSEIDAILADDTILYGLAEQDRTTRILDTRLTTEPYGLAMNKAHPDFVRFVNGVLERMRADGTLARLEAKWLGDAVKPLPAVPAASYRD
jgi:polar amino acid transport system substrate-binding protein